MDKQTMRCVCKGIFALITDILTADLKHLHIQTITNSLDFGIEIIEK